MLTQLEESYYEREIQKVYMKPTKVPFTLDRIWREDEMQAHLKLDYWSLHLLYYYCGRIVHGPIWKYFYRVICNYVKTILDLDFRLSICSQ